MAWPELLKYARRVKASHRRVPANAPKRVELYDVQDQTASAKLTASWGTPSAPRAPSAEPIWQKALSRDR